MRKTARTSTARRETRRTTRFGWFPGLWLPAQPKKDEASEGSKPSQQKTTPEEEEQQFQQEVTVTLTWIAIAFVVAVILGSLYLNLGK